MIERVYRNKNFSRPFSGGHPMHITLRTSVGNLRANGMKVWLDFYLPACARRNGIRLFHFGIVGNHLHLALLAAEKQNLHTFLRTISGVVARRVLGAEKGNAKRIKFWDGRPYSRVLTWGRELQNVISYIERNALEASGRISYVERGRPLVAPIRQQIQHNLLLASFSSLSRQMTMEL